MQRPFAEECSVTPSLHIVLPPPSPSLLRKRGKVLFPLPALFAKATEAAVEPNPGHPNQPVRRPPVRRQWYWRCVCLCVCVCVCGVACFQPCPPAAHKLLTSSPSAPSKAGAGASRRRKGSTEATGSKDTTSTRRPCEARDPPPPRQFASLLVLAAVMPVRAGFSALTPPSPAHTCPLVIGGGGSCKAST